ncbi:MAG: hypothetical protein WC686_03150 [Candidatus Shapirobacteria bacterium]|jgi:hypothetical protein
MAEFKRSRLARKSDEEITKKTIFLGLMTVVVFLAIMLFGLPLLVKFSIFLGEAKIRGNKDDKEKVLPPRPPRMVLPFEATNTAKININGFAEANVWVELLKNDVSIGKTQVGDTGEFRFGEIELNEGENEFSSIATTDDGGSSEVSKIVKITFDDKAPEFEMLNPKEAELTVDSADFDVIGKSEKGVSVSINGRMAMVDDEGGFKLKIQLNAGKNNVEVVVKDLAGNEQKKKITLTYDF